MKKMLIYLDTKDLINILEKSIPLSAQQLENFLRRDNHKIVISLLTVMEIAQPLLYRKATTNVMGLLNQLERIPQTYIHSDISRLELEEAVRAFSTNDDYRGIHAFVNRFDETCDLNAFPATKDYINFSLAETVWDLFNGGALGGLDKYATRYLKQTFAADRALCPKPSLKKHFTKKIEREIKQNNLTIHHDNIDAFAGWIYADASRCPSQRLGYEVWHKMVRNVKDIPHNSDLEDFQHIGCLPYVDLMTLDRRMHGYVGQVSKTLSTGYDKNIFRNTTEALKKMNLI